MIATNMKLLTLLLFFLVMGSSDSFAQCQPGEIEIELFIETDGYGYEGYWDLGKSGNGCVGDRFLNLYQLRSHIAGWTVFFYQFSHWLDYFASGQTGQ